MDTYYHFDAVTGVYLSSTPASLDPLETAKAGDDVYMRPPANASIDAPPGTGANQAAVYRMDNWVVVPDHRGEVYWLADGSEHTIAELDVVQPVDALSALPANIALARGKESKRGEIRGAYNIAVVSPQTVSGVIYSGGFDSVIRLDGAKRLAAELTAADVTLFDVDNVGHLLTIAEATAVVHAIGQQTQIDFAKKQGLMKAIDDAADQTAVDAIVW